MTIDPTPIDLACIVNSAAYAGGRTDVPATHAALARDPRIRLWHIETAAVLEASERGDPIVPAARIPGTWQHSDFGGLHALPTVPLAWSAFDLVFCRTLKPFPPGYLEALSRWARVTEFLNHPDGILTHMSPGFGVAVGGSWMPDAALVEGEDALAAYLCRHPVAVAKRPNSCAGLGVFRLTRRGDGWETDHTTDGPRTFPALGELWSYLGGFPLTLMRFLPRVTEGDKRVIVLEGDILGAYLRRVQSGHWVQNVSRGGDTFPAEVGPDERAAIAASSGAYLDLGVRLLGYDFLTDDRGRWRLSEINAGNIGGISRLAQLGNREGEARFVSRLVDLGRLAREAKAPGSCSDPTTPNR